MKHGSTENKQELAANNQPGSESSWSCDVCTFLNTNPLGLCCEICCTHRNSAATQPKDCQIITDTDTAADTDTGTIVGGLCSNGINREATMPTSTAAGGRMNILLRDLHAARSVRNRTAAPSRSSTKRTFQSQGGIKFTFMTFNVWFKWDLAGPTRMREVARLVEEHRCRMF